MCFFWLVVDGGSNVRVALAPEDIERALNSFLHAALEITNPSGKQAVVLPFLDTAEDVKIAVAWTDAISRQNTRDNEFSREIEI